MTTDLVYIVWWWVVIFFVGAIGFPLCHLIFKKFIDFGYGFSKTAGLLVISYIAFLGGIFHILPFTKSALYFLVILYAILNYYIFKKNKKEILSQVAKNVKILAAQELLFLFGLFLWVYVRAHQPDIVGLEKFMDFGFINSILRSQFLPSIDMWFSGKPINYYWFGHFFVATITQLSNIPSYITYNLMLATIMGLGLTGAFSISATLIKNLNLKLNKRIAYAAGIISAVLLIFAGNFHTPYYLWKNGRNKYWYPDATRFIGYNPDTQDKTIHEFPFYSFVVSDLHAHLINFPFVLLYIALLFNFVSKSTKPKIRNPKQYLNSSSQNPKCLMGSDLINSNLFQIPDTIILGFLLGVMFMTSAWDFANYGLVTGITFLLFYLKKRFRVDLETIWEIGKPLIIIVITSIITILPFMINFESLAQGVKPVHSHSPFWQLAILWGFPAALTAIFSFVLTKNKTEIKSSDIFVAALLISSAMLIALPEIIYVKDIYIASHYRANTMFKLTYQAFVMSYLSSGYIALRCLSLVKKIPQRFITLGLFSILFALVLTYPKIATYSYYADLKNYQGLDGEAWVAKRQPELYEVILWLRKNVEDQPVILEAPGDSYTEYNVVSAYTGLPTVSGWFVHEWLWRGDSSFPQARVGDITQIYTSQDITYTKSLLDKYGVEYVIIGNQEMEKYPNLNEEKFAEIGNAVFTSGNTKVYKLN